METLGKRLKEEREGKSLTQAALAKKSGCSQATIADIERGRNDGSAKLPSIAAALGLNAYWLETGRGPKYSEPNSTIGADGLYITDPKLIAIVRMIQEAEAPYLVDKLQKDLAADIEFIHAAGRAKPNNG